VNKVERTRCDTDFKWAGENKSEKNKKKKQREGPKQCVKGLVRKEVQKNKRKSNFEGKTARMCRGEKNLGKPKDESAQEQ